MYPYTSHMVIVCNYYISSTMFYIFRGSLGIDQVTFLPVLILILQNKVLFVCLFVWLGRLVVICFTTKKRI